MMRYTRNGYYKSRRHQLLDCARKAKGGLRANLDLMRGCAMIGACAERDRILDICRRMGLHSVANEVISLSIEDVWELPNPSAAKKPRKVRR